MVRILFLFPIACLFLSSGFSQSRQDDDNRLEKKGFYVVVGAFAIPKNAEKYCSQLKKTGLEGKAGFVELHRLYYVYTLFSDDATSCNMEAALLRSKSEFWDCWVYHIDSTSNSTVDKIDIVSIATREDTTSADHQAESSPKDSTSLKDKSQSEPVVVEQELPRTNEVFLSLYNSTNDKVVEGTVSLVNSDKSALIGKIKGNTYTLLPDPQSRSGKLTLLCDALGYRKVQHEVVFNSPLTDSTTSFVEDVGTALLVKFELIKYIKGDIRSLYSVYFYNDAAIMLPESKYELTQLKSMMAENPQYKIMLHGHTNGNYFGRFVSRSDNDDFFSIPKNARAQMGSARKLSLMRAEIIRQYLIKEGIDGARIQIKGWGGQRSLYDKHSAFAKKNVRVEVEILED